MFRDDYALEFNLTANQTQNMTFREAYHYADAMTAMDFEGIPFKQQYDKK